MSLRLVLNCSASEVSSELIETLGENFLRPSGTGFIVSPSAYTVTSRFELTCHQSPCLVFAVFGVIFRLRRYTCRIIRSIVLYDCIGMSLCTFVWTQGNRSLRTPRSGGVSWSIIGRKSWSTCRPIINANQPRQCW